MKNVTPLNGFVMVKDLPPPEAKGRILLPTQARHDTQMGKVLAAGPGWTRENGTLLKPGCKVGDIVFFGKRSDINPSRQITCGAVLEINGEDIRFVPCQEIIAIVEDV